MITFTQVQIDADGSAIIHYQTDTGAAHVRVGAERVEDLYRNVPVLTEVVPSVAPVAKTQADIDAEIALAEANAVEVK